MATTAKKTAFGSYEVFIDGKRVSTTSAEGLKGFGLSEQNLGGGATSSSTSSPAPKTGFQQLQDQGNIDFGTVNNNSAPVPYEPPRNVKFGNVQTQQLTSGAIGQSGGGFQADDPEVFRGMIEGVMESLVGSGKIIHPDITVDQLADINIADFLAQAEAEIAPEYKQKFDAVKSDLSTFFERTGIDLGLARDSVNRESDAVQLEADESFAGRGLAFSSRRNTFDDNLDSATDRSLSALDRGASRDAIDKGTAAERLIGTENLRGLSIPKIGEQRFALSTEPVIGSLQREKQFTKEGIAKQLEFDERARRAFSSRNLSFA